MKIFPAIDLRGGKAVRLYQGDYDQETVYSDDPVAVARGFWEVGARHLHLVDLDGARDGQLVNFEIIRRITGSLQQEVMPASDRSFGDQRFGEDRGGNMFVEIGGGIRDEERVRQYLDVGVSRVILGTVAVEDPDFVAAMAEKYREKIAVGVDARDGKVAIHGWKTVTEQDSFAFCKRLIRMGVGAIIYTDIDRDGGLSGTNLEAYRALQQMMEAEQKNAEWSRRPELIASGGISFPVEIEELAGMVDGAVLGKALYTGDLDLADCIRMAGRQ